MTAVKLKNGQKLNNQTVEGLTAAGCTQSDIARLTGADQSTISRMLKKMDAERTSIGEFVKVRAMIMQSMQAKTSMVRFKILDSLLNTDFNDPNITVKEKGDILKALTIAQATDFDKERLEQGKSTQNIATWSAIIKKTTGES